jgi:hypothetical protein
VYAKLQSVILIFRQNDLTFLVVKYTVFWWTSHVVEMGLEKTTNNMGMTPKPSPYTVAPVFQPSTP